MRLQLFDVLLRPVHDGLGQRDGLAIIVFVEFDWSWIPSQRCVVTQKIGFGNRVRYVHLMPSQERYQCAETEPNVPEEQP
jgi:hypothetical protein